MKLSTSSRYGTRLMLDMAQHYNEGPIHLGDIAKRQDVSGVAQAQQWRPKISGVSFCYFLAWPTE